MCTSNVIKTNIKSLFLMTFFMLIGFHNDAWFYKVQARRRQRFLSQHIKMYYVLVII